MAELRGQKHTNRLNELAVDGSVGFTTKGYAGTLAIRKQGIGQREHSTKHFRLAISYMDMSIPGKDIENFNRDIDIPVRLIDLTPSFNYTVTQSMSYSNEYYLSFDVGIGPVIGYELINEKEYILESGEEILDRSGMVYGGAARAELEWYFGIEQLTVFVSGEQKYLVNSDLGNGRFSASIGIRFWFINQ